MFYNFYKGHLRWDFLSHQFAFPRLVPFPSGPGGTPCCSFVISTAATGADWQNIDKIKHEAMPNFTEPHVCCKLPMLLRAVQESHKYDPLSNMQIQSNSCNVFPQLKISIGLLWTDLSLISLLRLLEAAENWAREMLAGNWCHFSGKDFGAFSRFTKLHRNPGNLKTSWLHLCILWMFFGRRCFLADLLWKAYAPAIGS